jgi:hypothetical protein
MNSDWLMSFRCEIFVELVAEDFISTAFMKNAKSFLF